MTILDTRSGLSATTGDNLEVRLIELEEPDTSGVIEIWTHSVEIWEGVDAIELNGYEDEHQARAAFRNICWDLLGIRLPYQAPQFEVPIAADPASAVNVAVDLYYAYHSRLSRLPGGSDEALAVRDEMIADPAFIEHASEILETFPGGDSWIDATIRVASKRVIHQWKIDQERASKALIEHLPSFGMF